ncbi:universal stress protein [Streptomyces sp. NPDC088358]|uniref:universal stress protein n=1 Tax=Streptomyces sp. NPDC088358 TaxID=3365857 RepID=UPI00380E21CA
MQSYNYPTAYAPSVGPALQRNWAERVPREAEEDLRRRYPDLRISADQVDGQPVPVLLAAAADAELLVLGSRGLSGIGGFMVGSVALSVVARAANPVVLVRAEELNGSDPRPTEPPFGEVVLGLDLRRPADALFEFAFDAAARRASALTVVHGWTVPTVSPPGPRGRPPSASTYSPPASATGGRTDRTSDMSSPSLRRSRPATRRPRHTRPRGPGTPREQPHRGSRTLPPGSRHGLRPRHSVGKDGVDPAGRSAALHRAARRDRTPPRTRRHGRAARPGHRRGLDPCQLGRSAGPGRFRPRLGSR